MCYIQLVQYLAELDFKYVSVYRFDYNEHISELINLYIIYMRSFLGLIKQKLLSAKKAEQNTEPNVNCDVNCFMV